MRKVIVAPTAFKGTLGPGAVARALAEGVSAVWPAAEVIELPLADGGNGLLEAYEALFGGTFELVRVAGPLGEPVPARLLYSERTAVVESAEACGLHLVSPRRRNPLLGSTRGVGELLRAASGAGVSEVVLGLGGSATVDGGSGMARALGWRFFDVEGRELPEGGGALLRLNKIDPPRRGPEVQAVALCDVDNPLCGPLGAARVYGPQKGAGPDDVDTLEAGLARLADVLESQLGQSLRELPGAGAGGGLGLGARAFLGARLVSGGAWMIERAGLVELLAGADLMVTGEGRFDEQSMMGKVTGRALEAARSTSVPVLLVCGTVEVSVPPGVRVVEGSGHELRAEDLVQLAASGCRGLAGEDRL